MDVYHDKDASLEVFRDQTLGIMGCGNQGRVQGLNLRDAGLAESVSTSPKEVLWRKFIATISTANG